MRIVYCILSAVLCAAVLAGCGKPTDSQPDPTPTPIPTATPAPTPEPTVDINTKGGYPQSGDELGRIYIPGTQVDCTIYWDDTNAILKKGAGTYAGAYMPGQGGTILACAHTNAHFRDLESVELGDDIVIETYYGEYHYKVVDMKVAREDDTTAYDLEAPEENLILYTCYPFGTLSRTYERYFVYGEFVSGPQIVEGTTEESAGASSIASTSEAGSASADSGTVGD